MSYELAGYEMGVAAHRANRWDLFRDMLADPSAYGVGFRKGWAA